MDSDLLERLKTLHHQQQSVKLPDVDLPPETTGTINTPLEGDLLERLKALHHQQIVQAAPVSSKSLEERLAKLKQYSSSTPPNPTGFVMTPVPKPPSSQRKGASGAEIENLSTSTGKTGLPRRAAAAVEEREPVEVLLANSSLRVGRLQGRPLVDAITNMINTAYGTRRVSPSDVAQRL